MKLRYTPAALADVEEAAAYIIENFASPDAAARMKANVLKCCAALKEQPFLGPSCNALGGPDSQLRYLVCGRHIAFYEVDEQTVSVYRILDSCQDYLRIIFPDATTAAPSPDQA